jgi:deoxyribonuclease-4
MKKIGVHVSIAGGIHNAILKAEKLNISAIQIFLKNNTRWEGKAYSEEEIEKFIMHKKKKPDLYIVAHSGYLINLAGGGDNYKKSIEAMKDEMVRAAKIGISGIVVHPGSHLGDGIDTGIKRISTAIDILYNETGSDVRIILETTSGQGFSVGNKFEHMRYIIGTSHYSDRLDVCFDTCHVFAAGYNIADPDECNSTMKQFDAIIGLKKMTLIHLNDSKKECGSSADRHEHIGKGCIGNYGFKIFLNNSLLPHIPIILETPKTKDDSADIQNLKQVGILLNEA